MHQAAAKLTNYLIENEIAADDMREQHIYFYEVMFGKILNYSTLFLLALINKNLIETLLFMCVFFSLRAKTGGFHASSPLKCYLGTFIIYFITTCVVAPFLAKYPIYMTICSIFSVIVICIFAPVNHPNMDLDSMEIKYCRLAARKLSIILLFIILFFLYLNIFSVPLSYAVSGMGIDTGLILLAKTLHQEVKENERIEEENSQNSSQGS